MHWRDLKPDDARFFLECVRTMERYPECRSVVGHINFWDVAERMGFSMRWAETRNFKFSKWGWVENRNDFDGYLTKEGQRIYDEMVTFEAEQWSAAESDYIAELGLGVE